METKKMTMWEVEAFVAFVRHYMPMEMRHEMMKAMPGVYNKVVGWEVMEATMTEKAKAA